jgi:dTDP-glucose pyrophosphorylase
MMPFRRHIIQKEKSIKEALKQLDDLAADAILFVVDEHGRLFGSLTDGDVRRGFLKGHSVDSNVDVFANPNPRFVLKDRYTLSEIVEYRTKNFKVVPVVDKDRTIVNVINFRFVKSYLPIDAVVMAGGKGERLRPLTEHLPKPLLRIGDKPIIEHNISRLMHFGVDDFWISVRYLGHMIEEYFGDGADLNVSIRYVREDEPMGTIGALSQITDFRHDYVLVTNSDVLTNLDYENFFLEFLNSGADLSVVTIPYSVNIPYAVLETDNGHVVSFREKPTYTYYSNGGIYLMKRDVLSLVPPGKFFNATDLMEALISKGGRVHSYPLLGYWLDIGKPEDYAKAQQDINFITF